MKYDKYILPGNQPRSFILGKRDVLVQQIEDGVLIHEFNGEELVREKIVNEVSRRQATALTRLGVAEGEDIGHCVYLANQHCKGFLDRVTSFRRERPTMFFAKVRVDFYAAGAPQN